jgi:hypothetical protein
MFSVNLSTREGDGRVVPALSGDLDVTDAGPAKRRPSLHPA